MLCAKIIAVPKISETLKDTTTEEGKSAKLTLKCSGLPEPTVQWFKDGAQVMTDARIKIFKDAANETYSLTVDKCTAQDQGSYQVKMTNALGEVSASCTLNVDCMYIIV